MIVAETGRPLVQHVVDQVRKCARVRDVVVATDDERIVEALKPFKTRCVMTSAEHQSGTDRIAEVVRDLNDEFVVNVQGDEPEIEPEIVDGLIGRLEQRREEMVTAATAFPADADPSDVNLVKVVLNYDDHAMYFSRAAIPFRRDTTNPGNAAYYLHLGIYGYQREFLLSFTSWPQTPCEMTEKLEQLRALENGHKIFVLKVERATHGIDTVEQYEEFVKRFKERA